MRKYTQPKRNYACSLSKKFDDLEYLLKKTNMNFDILAISGTRITKNVNKIPNINLCNYAFEFTSTESSAVGTLIYVANHLAYKPRTDLQIYKKSDLESTFIEIINPKKSNIIVGCIYRHPNMDLNEFNSDYLNPLLAKLSKEKKNFSLWVITMLTFQNMSNTPQLINFQILLPHLCFFHA